MQTGQTVQQALLPPVCTPMSSFMRRVNQATQRRHFVTRSMVARHPVSHQRDANGAEEATVSPLNFDSSCHKPADTQTHSDAHQRTPTGITGGRAAGCPTADVPPAGGMADNTDGTGRRQPHPAPHLAPAQAHSLSRHAPSGGGPIQTAGGGYLYRTEPSRNLYPNPERSKN